MQKCSVNWQVWPFEAETWTVVQEIHHENAPLDLEGHVLRLKWMQALPDKSHKESVTESRLKA